MPRRAVIAEELQLDDLDKVCFALQLDEQQCTLIREAAEAICTKRGRKKKRKLSDYNIFTSKCMKDKKIKKFEEASSAMKECALEWKVEKEKRSLK